MQMSRTLSWIAPSLTALGVFTAETAESHQLGKFGVIVAFVAGCATLFRVVIKPGYKMFKKMQSLFEAVERIDKEMIPNGGGSIKDALNRIEQRQMRSEQRHKVLLLDSKELVYETDSEGGTIWVNRTYTKTVGKALEELNGKGWLACIVPEDRYEVSQEWETCFSQHRDFDMNFKMISQNGIINVNSKAHPLVDDQNKVIGYLGHTTVLG